MDPQPVQPSAGKKRKVAEEHSPGGSQQMGLPQRSSKFWFQDGNLVLQTEDTQYRVHQGVLRIQSSVFDDMFEMPQPESKAKTSQEELDGCPVVPVTDSTQDWDALLGLLYNTEKYIAGTYTLQGETILAMLRLGNKYDFRRFTAEALRQLLHLFPKYPQTQIMSTHAFCAEEDIRLRYGFEILQTIYDLKIQSALPMVYVTCLASRSMRDIIAGRDTPGSPVSLSQQTKDALILGKQELVASSPSILYKWLIVGKTSAGCLDDISCKDEINNLLGQILKDPTNLSELSDGESSILDKSKLCECCSKAALSKFDAGRRKILNAIPSFFGLPAWGQMTDF